MRIQGLNVGVEHVSRWRVDDELHLPAERVGPAYLPQQLLLDEVLRRPSLDERLADLLQPAAVDPVLVDPNVLTAVREDVQRLFASEAASTSHSLEVANLLSAAAAQLEVDVALDVEVRAALALLLRA